jgi:hypothetical protein
MNEFEKRLSENTAQLARIETVVIRLIDRLNLIYTPIAHENDSQELDLNPYAVLCQIAQDRHQSGQQLPVFSVVHH